MIQWHLLTGSVWVARLGMGFCEGHRMLAMWLEAAVKAALGRNRAVAMGTVKGRKVHDERLSGRFGLSPQNRAGTFS